MSVPFNLPYGYVAVYGTGVVSGMAGFIPNNQRWVFGTIYQIGNLNDVDFSIGDSVMWFRKEPTRDECILAYDRINYTVLEQSRIVLREIIP
ncbi:MAG TPA: hypothetical protein PKV73_01090 [Agriterribacter sp.]|nr:hypothetical protein [Agriterribacter sp.]